MTVASPPTIPASSGQGGVPRYARRCVLGARHPLRRHGRPRRERRDARAPADSHCDAGGVQVRRVKAGEPAVHVLRARPPFLYFPQPRRSRGLALPHRRPRLCCRGRDALSWRRPPRGADGPAATPLPGARAAPGQCAPRASGARRPIALRERPGKAAHRCFHPSQDLRDPGPAELIGAAPCPPARFPLVLGPDGRPALGSWGEGSKVRAFVVEAMQTRSARSLAASKLALDAALGQIALAVSMVMAGTGDLSTLQASARELLCVERASVILDLTRWSAAAQGRVWALRR